MDIKLAHTFLIVDDHDKALGFYRDALGFQVRKDVKFEGMRWLTLSPPSQPELEIVLESPAADPSIPESDRKAITELMAKGLLRGVTLTTDDVDAAFERIQATGAEVLQEPMDQHYGVRDCAFRDPAGNMIRINQPKSQ
ncbi:VOC family protein [Actinokineospora sp. NPDC004072]